MSLQSLLLSGMLNEYLDWLQGKRSISINSRYSSCPELFRDCSGVIRVIRALIRLLLLPSHYGYYVERSAATQLYLKTSPLLLSIFALLEMRIVGNEIVGLMSLLKVVIQEARHENEWTRTLQTSEYLSSGYVITKLTFISITRFACLFLLRDSLVWLGLLGLCL
jgi:hypothetical protein